MNVRGSGVHCQSQIKVIGWLVAAVGVAVYLVGQSVDAFQVMCAGTETAAKVVQISEDEVEDSRGRVGTITTLGYEFVLDGTRFTGKASAAGASWVDEERLRVLYNPENPAQNRGKGDRSFLGGLLVRFFAAAFSSIGLSARTCPTFCGALGDRSPRPTINRAMMKTS
jgi:hypothetical protein